MNLTHLHIFFLHLTFKELSFTFGLSLCRVIFQKKPKIMGKEHNMNDVSKHSTSTETLFFEKVSTECSIMCMFNYVYEANIL